MLNIIGICIGLLLVAGGYLSDGVWEDVELWRDNETWSDTGA